jgi:flagellar assembly protein FliH
MTSMSKVVPGKAGEDCQPWRAPDFGHEGNRQQRVHNIAGGSMRTQDQLDKIYKESYEQGFNAGREEGLKRGLDETRDQINYLQSIMASLAMPLLDLDKQVVDELVELSMAVVRHMVRRELKISPGEIVAVVRDALGLLPLASSEVSLELHPEDAVLIRNALIGPDSEPPWKIIEDPTLRRGGCRVISNTSRIDATVENRLNAAIASVMGGERNVD